MTAFHPPEAQLVATPYGGLRELTGKWEYEDAELRDPAFADHISVAWLLADLRGVTKAGIELLAALREEA